MQHSNIDVATPAGTMATELLIPDGAGPFGAVIVFVDAGGPRPPITRIGERIAAMGYLVAIPDLFFRSGSPFDLLPPGTPRDMNAFRAVFADPQKRQAFFGNYYKPATDYDNLREEIDPLLAALGARPDFNGKVGTTGYCMGGNASLRVAALFGGRIAAAASFHGGGLVTDQPDSVHLRAKDIAARVYVAGAIEDAGFTDAMKATLTAAFADARVDATVVTYQGRHGFVVDDHDVYDAALAAQHDAALAELFGATLK